MKLLALAILLAGFTMNTVSANHDAEHERKHKKCVSAKGHMKNGKCMRKGQELQAYSIN